MTLFEFVSVMISIVLGVSLTQALTGLANLAREWPKVRTFLPHTFWIIALVLAHFLSWWAVWDYRYLSWNYPRFVVALLPPLLLFFLSSVLFPERNREAEIDLARYFFRIRPWLMAAYAVLTFVWIIDGPFIFNSERLMTVFRIPQAIGLVAPIVGLRTSNRKVHFVLASAVLAVIVIGSVFRFLPGTFSPSGGK